MASTAFEPPVELDMLWTEDDAPLIEAVREEFGEQLNEQLTDVQLRCFIHGYKNEGKRKIIKRIRAKIEYQTEIGRDTLLDSEFLELPLIAQANPVCIFGQDKQGHPILYSRISKANFKMCQDFPDLMKTLFIRTLEHLEAIKVMASKDLGYDIWRHTTVIDAENLGLLDIKSIYTTLNELAQIANYKYPECAHKIIIINADWKFRFIKALFDYLIDETTAEKVKVLGTSFYKELVKEIDENQIPSEFGGTASEKWQNGGIILQKSKYSHTEI
jgi:hypothetical protein